jgi:hypothetical protein
MCKQPCSRRINHREMGVFTEAKGTIGAHPSVSLIIKTSVLFETKNCKGPFGLSCKVVEMSLRLRMSYIQDGRFTNMDRNCTFLSLEGGFERMSA